VVDEDKTLPWDKTWSLSWQQAVDDWKWESLGGGDWEKSDDCPRCGHGMTVLQQGSFSTVTLSEDSVLAIMVEAEQGPLLSDQGKFFARCDCGEPHEGRPSGITRGCGQWGEIDPPPDE
jgi:hypothetical protein